jgi:hypothetical protein
MTRRKQVFVTVIQIIQSPRPQLLLVIGTQGLKGTLSTQEDSCVAFVGTGLPKFHFRLAWRDLQQLHASVAAHFITELAERYAAFPTVKQVHDGLTDWVKAESLVFRV